MSLYILHTHTYRRLTKTQVSPRGAWGRGGGGVQMEADIKSPSLLSLPLRHILSYAIMYLLMSYSHLYKVL